MKNKLIKIAIIQIILSLVFLSITFISEINSLQILKIISLILTFVLAVTAIVEIVFYLKNEINKKQENPTENIIDKKALKEERKRIIKNSEEFYKNQRLIEINTELYQLKQIKNSVKTSTTVICIMLPIIAICCAINTIIIVNLFYAFLKLI